ncbi:MAG: prokaryotic E2 ligase family D protein [Lachnospiraceae bacterium]|nr:prokaryotic E2 ligase family D protein [Lachnospiraceae bacterium]
MGDILDIHIDLSKCDEAKVSFLEGELYSSKIVDYNTLAKFINKISKTETKIGYSIPNNCVSLINENDNVEVTVYKEACILPVVMYDGSAYLVPYPKLIFNISINLEDRVMNSCKCFAIKDSADPYDLDEELYLFPYSNVGGNGDVCFGSNATNDLQGSIREIVGYLLDLFYSAPYNGDYYNMSRTGYLIGSLPELFKKLNGHESFDDKMLVSTNKQIGEVFDIKNLY